MVLENPIRSLAGLTTAHPPSASPLAPAGHDPAYAYFNPGRYVLTSVIKPVIQVWQMR